MAAILRGQPPPEPPPPSDQPGGRESGPDLADVRGHPGAIHALTIAAAGAHNLLLSGPPGTGTTMLARPAISILPPLTRDEALAVTRVHSIAGKHVSDGLVEQRPFRAPHHTVSPAVLVGVGSSPRPGEATLAHHGILFLDELSELAARRSSRCASPSRTGAWRSCAASAP